MIRASQRAQLWSALGSGYQHRSDQFSLGRLNLRLSGPWVFPDGPIALRATADSNSASSLPRADPTLYYTNGLPMTSRASVSGKSGISITHDSQLGLLQERYLLYMHLRRRLPYSTCDGLKTTLPSILPNVHLNISPVVL